MVPILPIMSNFRAIKVRMGNLRRMIKYVTMAYLGGMFTFRGMNRISIMVNMKAGRQVTRAFIMAIRMTNNTARYPMVKVDLIEARERLRGIQNEQRMIRLRNKMSDPFPMLLRLMMFCYNENARNPLKIRQFIRSNMSIVNMFASATIRIITLRFQRVVILDIPIISMDGEDSMIRNPIL